MKHDPYSEEVRGCFGHPEHAGDIEGGVLARVDDQGMRLALAASIDGGTMTKLRFRAWGCPHFIAAAEAFCANYEGRAVSELGKFSASEIMQSLSIPVEKTGRILVLEDAIRSLEQMR